ncbi:hypothetical protein GYB59_13330 [bacterium]|nr:hypothetical protein [bacterium]
MAAHALRKEGLKVDQDVEQYLSRLLKKSIRAGTIRKLQDINKAVAALAAAGIEHSKQTGSMRRVNIEDIEEGWKSIAAVGNCPPHKCLWRSVVQREAQIQETLSDYTEILSRIRSQASE